MDRAGPLRLGSCMLPQSCLARMGHGARWQLVNPALGMNQRTALWRDMDLQWGGNDWVGPHSGRRSPPPKEVLDQWCWGRLFRPGYWFPHGLGVTESEV